MTRPLFLFSVPRGGSTLVQRVLATHPAVSTVSEPWLLLPLLYARRESGVRAEYWHQTAAQAIEDFCKELPGGVADYEGALRRLTLDLYDKATEDGATYFLDKTPHYHFVADDLLRVFDDAKAVFLWRNPLGVVASNIVTFRSGRWQPHYFVRDLVGGHENLVSAWERHRNHAHAVRYEDLVSGDDGSWKALFEYLELDFDPQVLSRFTEVELRGRYGDPTGSREYASVSDAPVDKWKQTLGGPVRAAWCRRYLRRLGDDRLAAMGYDLQELLAALGSVPPSRGRGAARDLVDMCGAAIVQQARDAALRLPESARPIGPAFRPRPPLTQRARGAAGAARRRLRRAPP